MDDHPKPDELKDLPKSELHGPIVNWLVPHGMEDEDATRREASRKEENKTSRSEESRTATRREMSEKAGNSRSDELPSMAVKSEAPLSAESRVESKPTTFLARPKNSCQFQAHWKVLRKKEDDFFPYFKVSLFASFRFVSSLCFSMH